MQIHSDVPWDENARIDEFTCIHHMQYTHICINMPHVCELKKVCFYVYTRIKLFLNIRCILDVLDKTVRGIITSLFQHCDLQLVLICGLWEVTLAIFEYMCMYWTFDVNILFNILYKIIRLNILNGKCVQLM